MKGTPRTGLAVLTMLAVALAAAVPADACLLANRLRVVAPHLTEAEIELYAHGNMEPVKIPYELAAATPCVGGQADIFSCDGVDLMDHLNLSEIGGGNGNDLWGWTDPVTGAEIAIIGRTNGTAFVDVSDPANAVYLGNLPSHSGTSSWRDIKTFADHAFIVADGQPHGIQVFDLTQLRGVTNPPVSFSATAHFSGIGNAHNIAINEATGFAYAVGSNACSGGLYMVDVNIPTSPTFAGCFSADGYTHDAQCVIYSGPDTQHTGKEICFASNEDTLTIVDVTTKSAPVQLSRVDYTQPGDSHYAHQGWLTEDQQYFVFDDEFDELGQGHNTRTYVWDVSDLDAPALNGFTDAAGSSIDHNQYIKGNRTYQANYSRGLRIMELTDLSTATLTEVGFFDTYPNSDGNSYTGAWSTYPFFASGIVLVSDINRGLFILQPVTGCTVDADCDDGAYCNGDETCNVPSGTCQAGTPVACDDDVACTDDACNEATDSCDFTVNDGNCDNGAFCDGAETCDPVNDCQVGTPVVCDDGVACTDDACNETTDSCDNAPNDANCDNGAFCDGAETCDPVLDCQGGTDPCAPLACDEVADQCVGGATAQLESACLSVGGSPVTVPLANTYVSAVVTTSVQYANNTTPVVPRVSNVTATSFDVRLQNPSNGAVAADNLCYLVVEEGTWTIDGVDLEAQKYTSTVTDDAPSTWVGEAQSYGQSYTSPVVLGQVMSENDAGFSVFWDQGDIRGNPPTGSTLRTGKTVCEDSDVTRADETVGFIVVEAGHGTLAGVEYEAALGPDTVAGVTNAPPYAYTFQTPFATAPTVAVTTMAAVDGNNGGWAQIHGPTMATATTLNLSIDEDQIGDTERSHTNEQVAYVAFAGPVVYPDAGCTSDVQCDNGLYCDGFETCDIPSGTCQAGTPPVCDDGVACTDDACNEGTDACDHVADDSNCDNGQFCDGAETCDPVSDCQAGAPVACDDGVGCTVDSCNETTDSCDNPPDDGLCNDGQFCNGAETCDPVNDCQAGSDPCPGQTCDEVGDVCTGGSKVMEWGTVTVGAGAATVNLGDGYTNPVVVTAVHYANNTVPVVTRISNLTSTSFDVRLQNAGAGSVVADTVSWLVVEAGVHTVNGVLIEAQTYTSTVTDDNGSWIGQPQTLAGSFSSPVVLGQVMSDNDPDFSVFWDQGTSRQNPPTASALTTGKTVCEDTDATRADETVGFVVIEAGHGTLGGVEFEAALGADSVRGVGNAPPYAYSFVTPFATAPTVSVVTMAAVDGGNGGWAQVHGPTMATTTILNLSIDEDTIGDSERSHTPEQVGYVVFAGPGSASP